MSELIENLANNNNVIIGLSVLLGILVILFIIMLFSNKGKKPKKEETLDQNIEVNSSSNNNIDFDHGEYVKETTAEFELTPITEVNPVPDEFVPNVNVEESPAIDKSKNVEDVPLADFNFDDLSKSISEELDKLKEEEYSQAVETIPVAQETNIEAPKADVVDAFKEVEPEFKSLDVAKFEEFTSPNINPSEGIVTPEAPISEPSFITDFSAFETQTEPVKPAEIEKPVEVSEVVLEKPIVNEPVIKENDVPLFARFNQETYDINKKD